MNTGSAPWWTASRRSRRASWATWLPKMPRKACSSSSTMKRSRPRKVAQRSWCGSSPACSISGLVSTTDRVLADPGALLGAGVAVVGAGHHTGEVEGGERAELVVGQRLGGEHGERGAGRIGSAGGLRDGHLVAERLPRRGARRDDHRVAGACRLDGFDLVRPERPGQALRDGVGERPGELGVPRRTSGLRVRGTRAGSGPRSVAVPSSAWWARSRSMASSLSTSATVASAWGRARRV